MLLKDSENKNEQKRKLVKISNWQETVRLTVYFQAVEELDQRPPNLKLSTDREEDSRLRARRPDIVALLACSNLLSFNLSIS